MASGATAQRPRRRRRGAIRGRPLPVRSLALLTALLVSGPASAAMLARQPGGHATPGIMHGRTANPRRSAGHLRALIPPGETLLTVSCSVSTSCATAGADETFSGPRSVAEQWNGVTWRFGRAGRLPHARHALLSAVSCAAPRACIAVGAYFSNSGRSAPLAQAWNGSAWRPLATPGPPARLGIGSALTSVSCPSPAVCIAVGRNQTRSVVQTLAERWDGHSWRILRTRDVPRARVNLLSAVSCSAATACTAVGSYTSKSHVGFALAERWNGAGWRMQAAAGISPAASNALYAVSCPAARTCIAVGGAQGASGAALTERWNGALWRLLPGPAPAGSVLSTLAGISCRSAASCQAVGYDQLASGQDLTLIAAWNGAGWRVEPSASRGIAAELFAVSCPAARRCIAIGGYGARSGTRLTLAEVWNGIRWRVRRLPVS